MLDCLLNLLNKKHCPVRIRIETATNDSINGMYFDKKHCPAKTRIEII